LGQDFSGKDGWSMYHGARVPGFPAHPHRGFETVTIVRRGLVDHCDSLGAAARYGNGDVQWLTAGSGIQHSEMFPLLQQDHDNPAELFQIWLNLPARSKMAAPHFGMFWSENIPRHRAQDAQGRSTEVVCVAGSVGSARALAAPPHSWASAADSDVAIWTLRMQAGARWTLPAASLAQTRRQLYFFSGQDLQAAGQALPPGTAIELRSDATVELVNGGSPAEMLLLQGRPIGEAVAQYGPFVMNSQAEIHQAFADYRQTGFGGWPWPRNDPVHPHKQGRFARHVDGSVEHPVTA
ncbi:MAG: pirin family protein, partial [Rhodoferax sp.]